MKAEPTGLVRLRTQLSNLEGLLIIFMLMTESNDEDRILTLGESSLASLAQCQLVGVYRLGDGWQPLERSSGPSTSEALEAELLSLNSPGGPVTVAGSEWAWAYPLRSEAGHIGFFVVAADAAPSQEEVLLVRLLAWATGAALGNARRHARVKSTADELASMNKSLEQRFTRGFRHSPIGMALVSPDGAFLQVNQAYCEMLGRTEEELLQTNVQAITHPDDLDLDLEARALMVAGELEAHQREKRYIRADGEIVWGLLSITLIRDAAGEATFFTQVQDLTEQKLAENRLREAYQKELETAERLRHLDQMKDEFLAIVSHELKTPLTPILGFAENLLGNYGDFDDATKRDLLERIQRNARGMTQLVGGLLDLSHLQAGRIQLKPEPIPLARALKTCVGSVSDALGDRWVTVHVPPDMEVEADPEALARIVAGLLANAAKFSPPSTPIKVIAEDSEGEVIVSVIDRGPGIAPGDRDLIFERFWQGADQPAGSRGPGLGLTIAKHYVELWDGRIWVEAQSGRGSTFSFTLPKRKAL
jgi:PAS domain S-box-containing protein